jgi:hypothetical protein
MSATERLLPRIGVMMFRADGLVKPAWIWSPQDARGAPFLMVGSVAVGNGGRSALSIVP